MEIRNISNIYTALPQCGAFLKAISDESVRHVFLGGLLASSAPVFFSAVAERLNGKKNSKPKTQNCAESAQQFKTQNSKLKTLTAVFILQDNDEAGYFYHDLTQILGTDNVLFFPSSYRRAVKYGQRDAANEILRTETLSRLAALTSVDTQKASTGKGAGKNADSAAEALYVVTCPEALSELVVSKRRLDERTINIAVGDIIDFADLGRQMREFGFKEVEGIHSRTDFDLGNHQKFSGKKIQYFDTETGESYVPYVVETSIGVDRMYGCSDGSIAAIFSISSVASSSMTSMASSNVTIPTSRSSVSTTGRARKLYLLNIWATCSLSSSVLTVMTCSCMMDSMVASSSSHRSRSLTLVRPMSLWPRVT